MELSFKLWRGCKLAMRHFIDKLMKDSSKKLPALRGLPVDSEPYTKAFESGVILEMNLEAERQAREKLIQIYGQPVKLDRESGEPSSQIFPIPPQTFLRKAQEGEEASGLEVGIILAASYFLASNAEIEELSLKGASLVMSHLLSLGLSAIESIYVEEDFLYIGLKERGFEKEFTKRIECEVSEGLLRFSTLPLVYLYGEKGASILGTALASILLPISNSEPHLISSSFSSWATLNGIKGVV